MANAWYLASPAQDDRAAQARATELGCVGFSRHVPSRYADRLRSLPAVVIEAQPSEPNGLLHEPCTRGGVDAALAPLQALDDAVAVRQENDAAIRDHARNALGVNRTYLAISIPSRAHDTAQVRALTRQVQGLLQLLVGDLNGTD